MADKSIDQLNAAENILATDLFVLQQSGTAKKLPGQVLLNWLTAAADGHGGIQNISKISSSGLADTYRITLADTTKFNFVVTNGRGVSSITKTGTSGLVDTYRIDFNDGTANTFTVTNGAKGNKGDNAYIWIKYASQQPTAASHSFGDIPDDWIGFYAGTSTTAPTDWQQYDWYKIKGEKGDTGDPATLVSSQVTYQVGDSGTVIPSGSWSSSIPVVTQGKYLWTRQILQFNTGNPITTYSVARFGIDGTGAVSTVNGVGPDADGNVALDAASVNALAITGGTMQGAINMNGQTINGLSTPTSYTQPATKKYADDIKAFADRKCAKTEGTASLTVSGWGTGLTQTVSVSGVTVDNTVFVAPNAASHVAYAEANVRCTGQSSGKLTFTCDEKPTAALTVNVVILT